MDASPRPPAVAGQFYPSDARELGEELDACFLDPRGPGRLPELGKGAVPSLRAAIVPHAGYAFSGPIAARAFGEIAERRPPESVLILGVDHRGAGGAALSRRPWRTPLGRVEPEPGLIGRLDRPPVEVDERAHAKEHSIEVELPFLQRVLPQARFAALQVPFGPYPYLEAVAAVVREAVRGRPVLLIASTDFSHYVPASVAKELDAKAIAAILRRDPRALYDVVVREEISMCGIAPTTVLLAAVRDEPLAARLLRWGHSGEAAPMADVVGYASLVLEGPRA